MLPPRRTPFRSAGRSALAAVAVCALAGCGAAETAPAPISAQEPTATQALVAHRGALRQTLLLSGQLTAVHGDSIVVPPSPTYDAIIRWMIEEGTAVQAGDPLIELDTSAIAAQRDDKQTALEERNNQLIAKQAEVTGEQASKQFKRDQARVNLRKAEIDADVPEELQSERDFREHQLALEQARTALEKTEADLATFEETSAAEIDVLEIDVEKAQREVEEVERALATMVLRAPRAGIMIASDNYREGRKFQVGDQTYMGAELATIPDLSEMMVDTRLSDVDDGKVTQGMRVVCTLDAYPDRSIEGVVRSITPVAQWVNMRSDQRFFRVAIDLQETDPEIMRPGMSVKVEVVTATVDDAILAPRAALEFEGDQVFALRAGGERQPVVLGPCDAAECSVESGLEEGAELERRR